MAKKILAAKEAKSKQEIRSRLTQQEIDLLAGMLAEAGYKEVAARFGRR